MSELRLWVGQLVRVQGLLVVLIAAMGATSTLAEDNPNTAAIGEMLSSTTLIAHEIEAQLVALQVELDAKQVDAGARQLSQALISFYAQREYHPVWDQPEHLQQLITEIEALSNDGLDPEDYQVAQLRNALLLVNDDSTEAIPMRVADELRATNAYLRALYHLFNGKVDPAGLDPQWNFELQDIAAVADGLRIVDTIESGQIAQLFEKTRPQHMIYRSFKAGLQHYRQLAAQGGWPSLPVGPTLKPCMVDPQVAILRKRLQVTGEYVALAVSGDPAELTPAQKCFVSTASSSPSITDLSTDTVELAAINGVATSSVASEESMAATSSAAQVDAEQVFDEHLVAAVKQFQREQYLEDDGAIGPATRAALNVSVQSRIDQIRVNLDRARWLLHNIPTDMLLVDVAGFKVTYVKASQPIWHSRVQVGMAYRTSPIFKSEVNYITLNPTWTVPPTILRNDTLPKIRKDPGYLKRSRMRVLDSSGKELNPANINWSNPGNVTLRQDAGEGAALGKAVIRFPNPYSVYLHDTPHQELFVKSQRAFSSGCIRVERALELVELLLAETPSWDKAAIDKALAAGKTRNVTLAKRVPILIAYWTVDAVSETHVAFKPDIYARDAKVLAALNKRN